MKEKFLNYSMTTIQKNNQFDEIKLAELEYGLEAFYMLISKILVTILIAYILGILKETILFILFFMPLRGLGFGFHANNSKQCWIVSGIVFITFPMLAKLNIPLIIIHIFILLGTISFLLFAPADTKKKPLVNMKKRLLNKSILVLISLIYLYLTIIIHNSLIINSLMFACIWETLCINPLMYKVFHQTFNNYKTYNMV